MWTGYMTEDNEPLLVKCNYSLGLYDAKAAADVVYKTGPGAYPYFSVLNNMQSST